ncbi:MAG: tryptophan-rich sensory protein [Patescibacteria group bacterium]|nr:tryptophan-rich sensory protein [Patescibacteria group bacterium]
MGKIAKIAISIIVCEAVGLLGGLATASSVSTWFETLNKPFFTPPNWLFAPAWTILYVLMGIAAGLIWTEGLIAKKNKIALKYFSLQLFLNFLWSIFFFGLKSPVLAFIDVILLWTFILLTIFKFKAVSKTAAYLMIPYLAWVTFASLLNLSIIILN